MFFVIEKLFDKLPDIMGSILPSLDQESKNPNAINGTVAKRSNVKIWRERDTEWEKNIRMKYTSSKSFARPIFPSWRWGERLNRQQLRT